MFNCYAHGWSSGEYPCRMCFPLVATTSSSTTFVYPDAIVGVSSEKLKRLQAENIRFREVLKYYAGGDTVNTFEGDDRYLESASDRFDISKVNGVWITGKRARAALEGKE